jgi:hypothetical protein
LRFGCDACAREYLVAIAYSRPGMDGNAVQKVVVIAQDGILVNAAERAYGIVVAYLGIRMNEC